jgi:phage recombination protein Bet
VRQTYSRGTGFDERGNKVAVFANDAEWELFTSLAQATRLNPALREIWCVPYVKKSGERNTLIMVGINGLVRIANEHPQFDGLEVDITPKPSNSKIPDVGVCRLYRKDRTRPVTVTLLFDETKTSDDDWSRWKKAPFAQFSKCLKAAAIREAFPQCAGLYLEDEVKQEREVKAYVEPESTLIDEVVKSAVVTQPVQNLDAVIKDEEDNLIPLVEPERSSKAEYLYELAELEPAKITAALALLEKAGARKGEGTVFVSPVEIKRLERYEVQNVNN